MKYLVMILCLAVGLNAASNAYLNTAVTNTPVDVKTSGGGLNGYMVGTSVSTSGTCYIQVFNDKAASVILGTTVPEMIIIYSDLSNLPIYVSLPTVNFSTAISVAATSTPTGSSVCNQSMIVNMFFQ